MKLSSRRGISEIISALLVVCITVSAATLLGAYASGLMGRIQTRVSQPYTEQLTLDYYQWCNGASSTWSNGNCVTIASLYPFTIRNDGAAAITLNDFYIEGGVNGGAMVTSISNNNSPGCPSTNTPPSTSPPYTIAVQSTCTLTITTSGLTGLTITAGSSYTVKLVANDGTIFTFSCIAGSYT